MTKNLLLSVSLMLALGGTASAGGSSESLGVGGEFQLNGLGGMSLNYDMGQFHLGGFFGFQDGGGTNDTDIAIGGRFYYHLHSTAMADFGLGGSLGIGLIGDRDPNNDNGLTEVYLEPGFQVRAFVASNVALSFTGGLSLGLADANGAEIYAQPNAIAGFHYYFF